MKLKVFLKDFTDQDISYVQKTLEHREKMEFSVHHLENELIDVSLLYDFVWVVIPENKRQASEELIHQLTTHYTEKLRVIFWDGDKSWWRHILHERLLDLNYFALSRVDEVTGLGNQRLLKDDLRKFIYIDKPFILLFLDIDEFKKVNDGHGHLMGSKILKDVSALIKNFFDQKTTHLYRYGGDEFVAVLTNTSFEQAHQLAVKFSEKVKSSPFDIGKLSVSIGLSEFPTDAQSVDEMINIADLLMYSSKKNGKGLITHQKKK